MVLIPLFQPTTYIVSGSHDVSKKSHVTHNLCDNDINLYLQDHNKNTSLNHRDRCVQKINLLINKGIPIDIKNIAKAVHFYVRRVEKMISIWSMF
jgi:GH35 family endo-1,4-beta-xylanase